MEFRKTNSFQARFKPFQFSFRKIKSFLKKMMLLFAFAAVLYLLKGNISDFNITGMSILDIDVNNGNISNGKINNNEGADKVVKENIPLPEVYFCPRYNCSAVMVDLINEAEESVHCELFDLDLVEIIKVLDDKFNGKNENKKIDIKIVVDDDNYNEIEESYGRDLGFVSGGFVKQDNGNQLTHNKFCIIDKKTVTTGSFNPTINGNNKNNNNLVVVKSKYLSENYENEFDELWNGWFGRSNKDKQSKVRYPVIVSDDYSNSDDYSDSNDYSKENNKINGIKFENYFCPEDDCERKVIEVLDTAEESIKFMLFSFTSDAIGNKLVEKFEKGFNNKSNDTKNRNNSNGIIIKGVIEKMTAGSKYSQFNKLNESGIDVIKDNNSGNMHHKVFIIDDKIVITGSYNPTGSGDDTNDENVLVIYNKEIAKKYAEEFNRVYG
ncbi:MAG: phospholipase D-like domain-containing protein [Candidatus Woesearchaeota archaeon]